MVCEAQSRETISDSLESGCVIAGMCQNSMEEHLLTSATKCDRWTTCSRDGVDRAREKDDHCTDIDGS